MLAESTWADESTTAELVAAASAGDHDAFSRLVGPFRDELRAHYYRIRVGCRADEVPIPEGWADQCLRTKSRSAL
jgi:hypothetical protein